MKTADKQRLSFHPPKHTMYRVASKQGTQKVLILFLEIVPKCLLIDNAHCLIIVLFKTNRSGISNRVLCNKVHWIKSQSLRFIIPAFGTSPQTCLPHSVWIEDTGVWLPWRRDYTLQNVVPLFDFKCWINNSWRDNLLIILGDVISFAFFLSFFLSFFPCTPFF